MKTDNKFQHKWIFDPELAKCHATGMWSLTYVDGKGTFVICVESQTLFNKVMNQNFGTVNQMTDVARRRSRSIFQVVGRLKEPCIWMLYLQKTQNVVHILYKRRKKWKLVISTTNEKVFQSLYWLCKNEVAHSKLNSLLELVESLGVEEVVHFSKRSSTVLRKLLILIGDQVKEDLVGKDKKIPILWIAY